MSGELTQVRDTYRLPPDGPSFMGEVRPIPGSLDGARGADPCGVEAVTRVPVAVALLALSQSGYTLTAAALRQWVRRGHITRGPGGYCIREITAYIDRREARATRPAA